MTTKQQRDERVKTLLAFSRETLNDTMNYNCNDGMATLRMSAILDKLHRYEATLHRISENDCNGHPRMVSEVRGGKRYEYAVEDAAWVERDRKKEASIQDKVRAIAADLGFQVQFNGDPRGGAIRFILPSGDSNSFDRETWGIYW